MAKLSTQEEIALHEFSVRYRAALAKKYPAPKSGIDTVRHAVREQYEHEQEAERTNAIEPPSHTKEPGPGEPEQEL